ncbi:MAG: two-component regulator propeller domain-containing protein, partial [Candidatus Poribacteria bacterium]
SYVWFGTYDAGIIRYDKEKKNWQFFSKKDGLSHNCIVSIAVDGDQIWIGTQRGLTRYDKNKNTFTIFTQYDDSEDL